jgi:hypothetical protein
MIIVVERTRKLKPRVPQYADTSKQSTSRRQGRPAAVAALQRRSVRATRYCAHFDVRCVHQRQRPTTVAERPVTLPPEPRSGSGHGKETGVAESGELGSAKKGVRLSTVEAPDTLSAIEKAAAEFKVDTWRLYAMERR